MNRLSNPRRLAGRALCVLAVCGSVGHAAFADEAVVRTYAIGPQAAEVAGRIQAEFGTVGVRAAADPRTGQVVVVAVEAMQQLIALRVAPAAPGEPNLPAAAAAAPTPTSTQTQTLAPPVPQTPAAPAASAVAPTPQDPAAVTSHTLHVQRLDWQTLETHLRQLYGSRLSPTTTQNDGRLTVRLATVEGPPLELSFQADARRLEMVGPGGTIVAASRLIAALDRAPEAVPQRVVPYRRGDVESLRSALAVSHRMTDAAPAEEVAQPEAGEVAPKPAVPLFVGMMQPKPAEGQAPPVVVPLAPLGPPAGAPPAAVAARAADAAQQSGLVGPVQIEFLDGLDVLIISGNDRDVERVMKIIEDIERLSVDTRPVVEVVPLQHVAGDALATVVTQIYDSVLSVRQGKVSITALVKPNALLLIGRAESVQAVRELVTKLDQPVEPASQFAVFPLKYASAATVQTTITSYFADRTALSGKVQVTVDQRTNSLVVRGGPRDIAEAAELIRRLDTSEIAAENELRVFHLRNALASELAPILQNAINAQMGEGTTTPQSILPGLGAPAPTGTNAPSSGTGRSAALRFTTIDSQGHRQLQSGVLTEVKITADPRANALLVAAPAQAMELISALIARLDDTPGAQSQIKVFTIINGDASALVEMLQSLFGIRTTTGAAGAFGAQNQFNNSGDLLVPMRFSVDQRTNSIIASGAADDLNVVEAILLRLDDSDVRQRQSIVYRLKNAPALDVANAINQFLRSEREVQQIQPGLLSPFEQIEREVVVVPEPVSNSLIVSSTPRYFEEIRKLVVDIDARPPMVLIQVLIAEVSLNNTDEFGIELGLQDSVLFDRSLLGDLITIQQSTQQPQGNTVITTNNQNIVAASNTPGYAFNNAPLGNSGATTALARANAVGTQGLTNFAVGRTNADLGFGGLVLSASSESVSVLIRALQESRRLDVLSRPQVMTLDNQPAFVQVGSRVPRVQGVTIATTGQTNNVVDVNVGLILGVTPRISPDGLVVMEIDAEKSALGPESEGVPISVSATGEVVRQPVINTTTAQTTVSAMNGQTVVLGGLITKAKSQVHRRVPILSSIPLLGNLFRYDLQSSERTELLIIMTPHVVRTEADAARLRQIESARMSWVLGDVKQLTGTWGLQGRCDPWDEDQMMVIYPDVSPTGEPVPQQSMTEQGQPVPPTTEPGSLVPPPPPLPVTPGGASPIEVPIPNPLPMPPAAPLPAPIPNPQNQ